MSTKYIIVQRTTPEPTRPKPFYEDQSEALAALAALQALHGPSITLELVAVTEDADRITTTPLVVTPVNIIT